MASNLSKATNRARKAVIIFLIFAISTFVFRFLFGILSPEQSTIRTTPTPVSPYGRATQALGKIPRPQLESLPLSPNSNPRYSLQNRDTLPDFPPIGNIYVINQPREKLGNTSQGRNTAEQLEFTGRERIVSETMMFWQTQDTSRSLNYDRLFEDWEYKTDITKETLTEEQSELVGISREDGFYNEVGESIISSLDLNTRYFDNSNALVKYVDINQSTNDIRSEVSSDDANYVSIGQFKRIESAIVSENYRPPSGSEAVETTYSDIRPNDYRYGVFNMILRGTGEQLLPDLVSYNYLDFSYGQHGSYNLLTPEQAFVKVQNGEGILYWLKLKNENFFSNPIALDVLEFEVQGSEVSLIYIEPSGWEETQPWTNYLQIYYLFEGTALLNDGREADFAIVLEALADTEYE